MPLFSPVVTEYNIVVLNGTVQKFKSWSKLVDGWLCSKAKLFALQCLNMHLQNFFVSCTWNSYLVMTKCATEQLLIYHIIHPHLYSFLAVSVCLTLTVLKVLFPLFFYINYFCAWLNFVEGQSSRKDIVTGTSSKVLYSWLWMVKLGKCFIVYWWQYLQITKGKTSVLC